MSERNKLADCLHSINTATIHVQLASQTATPDVRGDLVDAQNSLRHAMERIRQALRRKALLEEAKWHWSYGESI